jgi:hypothetical protein
VLIEWQLIVIAIFIHIFIILCFLAFNPLWMFAKSSYIFIDEKSCNIKIMKLSWLLPALQSLRAKTHVQRKRKKEKNAIDFTTHLSEPHRHHGCSSG